MTVGLTADEIASRIPEDTEVIGVSCMFSQDWLYAKRVIQENELESRTHAVLISPVWGQVDLQQLANWVAASGLNVRMQLQLHKYIWGPDVQGV